MLDTGELEVIDNQVDQTTGTIRLKADFPNKDLQLWPGQFVNVRLLLNTLEQVVVVPTVGRAARPRRHVRLRRRRRQQSCGAHRSASAQQDEKLAVISKGVAPSDVVVTTGFARLKDGAEVKVSPPAKAEARGCLDDGTPQANAGATPAGDTASINAATPANMQGDLRREFRKGKRGDGERGRGGKRVTRPATAR